MSRPPHASGNWILFESVLSFRILNAVVVRTFFQPDEYYQALEPAWNFTPGHGSAWTTWEWWQHLRSALHPALFSAAYYLADIVASLTSSYRARDNLLLAAPKLVQAVLAAVGDYYTWKLSSKVYDDPRLGYTTLLLTVLSPWQWFCSTRTFSNGLESALTVAALYYWPFAGIIQDMPLKQDDRPVGVQGSPKTSHCGSTKIYIALILAATATILRPTNILVWIVLAVFMFARQNTPERTNRALSKSGQYGHMQFKSKLLILSRAALICGGFVFMASMIVDRAFYGVWTVPALNFLYFNVVQSLAVFYGNNNWHYYLTEGYPLLLTTALPFTLVGLYSIFRNSAAYQSFRPETASLLKQLATVCVALPAALSILSHKEVRFIYPILGPLHIIAAGPAFHFFGSIFFQSFAQHRPGSSNNLGQRLLLLLFIFLNIIIAGYTSTIHNSGLIALPEYIRKEFQTHYHPSSFTSNTKISPTPQNLTLAVLMPCHSLPWRSHFLNDPSPSHPGIQAWALTCEPPLHLTSPSQKSTYLDEADIFYANPTHWLRTHMSRRPPTDFRTPNLKGTDPDRSPGIYTAAQPSGARNKFLRHPDHSSPDTVDALTDRAGLDITDLLPYLRTAPGLAAATERGVRIRRPWPHYLAFFAQLEPIMVQTLRGSGYVECWRRFNSHWHDDWRRKGDVVVWCLFPERAMAKRDVGIGANVDVFEEERREKEKKKNVNAKVGNVVEPERAVFDRPGTQTVVRI